MVRPEMITQIIRKQIFCVTDVCAIWKFNSQTIHVCKLARSQEVPGEGAQLHKRIPARTKERYVIILSPIVATDIMAMSKRFQAATNFERS